MSKQIWYEYTVRQTYPVDFKVSDDLTITYSKKKKTVITKVVARNMNEVREFLRGKVNFISKKRLP